MKLAVVSNFYPPEAVGGAEIFARDLCEELGRRGFQVDVFTSTRHRPRVERNENVTVRFYPTRPPMTQLTSDILGYNFNPWAKPLIRALSHSTYDVLDIHNINTSIMLGPLLTAMRGVVVSHIHDHWPICYRGILYDPRHRTTCVSPRPSCCFDPGRRTVGLVNLALRQKLLHRFESRVAAFVVPSNYMKETLLMRGFSSSAKINWIRLGVNIRRITPGAGTRSGTFVFAGRLADYKNPQFVLRLAERGRIPSKVTFHIVGGRRGWSPPPLPQSPTTKPCVRFKGQLSREDTLREIQCARGLLVPSMIPENSPLVIYEALACGTPVLCTPQGGAKELVAASQAGRVISLDSPSGWEDAIIELLQNDSFNGMSARAREFAERELDIARCADATVSLYDRIAR